MKVVIAGAGSVGRYMATQLLGSGHQVVLIDNAPAIKDRFAGSVAAASWHLGDACETATLESAGVADADVVAAVTGDDEDNLVISLLSKQEFGVPRVVARVNNPNNEWMFNEMWGVDMSVSTPHLLTALVEEAVSEGSLVRLMALEHGKAQLLEVTLAASSPGIGKEIAGLGLPREAVVVAVIRDAHVIIPRSDTVLLRGDEVVVLATGDSHGDVQTQLVG